MIILIDCGMAVSDNKNPQNACSRAVSSSSLIPYKYPTPESVITWVDAVDVAREICKVVACRILGL